LGVTLEKHYTDEDSIRELLDGGDISSLRSDTGWDYNNKLEQEEVLYYNARGEDTYPKSSESLTEFFDLTEGTDGEYAYVFDRGVWTCYDMGGYGSRVRGTILDIPADYPVREPVA